MIFRTFDARLINRIANMPSVHKTAAFHMRDQALDFTEHAKRPDDYIILSNGSTAAMLFEVKAPVVLDGHLCFSPQIRRQEAISVGREMIDWLFCNTPALIITGAIPVDNEFMAARWFTRNVLRFKSDGIRTIIGVHWTHEFEHFHRLRSDWEADRTGAGLPHA